MVVKYPIWINKIDGAAQSPEEMNGLVEVLQNHAENLSLHQKQILTSSGGIYPEKVTPTSPLPEGISQAVFLVGPGTYPNYGNKTIPANNLGLIFFSNSIFDLVMIEISIYDDTSLKNRMTSVETKSTNTETKVDDFIEKKDIKGGWVSHDKFEEMASGSPSVVVKEYNSDTFNIIGVIDNSGTFHTEWNGGFVTDFIFISAGQTVEATGASNSVAEVPIFVVYKSDKKTVLFKQNAVSAGVNTKSYFAENDCYIRVNCALKANISSCKIIVYSRITSASKILSNVNQEEFTDERDKLASYNLVDDILEVEKIIVSGLNFDKTFNGFIQSKRLRKDNTVVDNPTDNKCYTLHNYVLNEAESIHLKGRLYDDRSNFFGFLGIKADGTIEDIYAKNGISDAWVQIDKRFDVSSYVKVSIAIDTSLYEFSGIMGTAMTFSSKKIDDLQKGKTLKDRIINGDKPSEVKGLTSQRNEANIFQFKGETFFLWSEGWNTSVIKVGKYNVVTNTVTDITTAVDATTSGINAPIFKCPTTFIINQKIYLIMTVWKPNNCILYESLDGRNFTEVSRTLANVAGFTTYGNHWIIPEKIDGYYYWFIEGLVGGAVWRMSLLKSKQIDTGWELVGEVKGLTSGTGAKGGPCVYYQNGKFKMIYHFGPGSTNLPTYIAYAEANVNDPLYFKPLYYPLMAIEHKPWGSLTDQYADPELCEIDGKTYLFCSVVDNNTPRATIYRWECDGRLSDILNSRI